MSQSIKNNFIKYLVDRLTTNKTIDEIHEEYFNSEEYIFMSTIFHSKNLKRLQLLNK